MIREASEPKAPLEIWEDLSEEWMPLSETTKSIRNYLFNYVWCKKKKCATAYFEELLTCGAMSTQRSDGWHAVLKQYANLKSLVSLFDSILKLVARQHVFEVRKGLPPFSAPVHAEVLLKIQGTHRTHA